MIERIKKLSPPKDRPQLSMGDYDEYLFEQKKERKLKIVYRIYILCAALIVVLCIGIIMFGNFSGKGSLIDRFNGFSDNVFEKEEIEEESSSKIEGVFLPSKDTVSTPGENEETDTDAPVIDKDSLYDFDYSKVPSGETPIIPMDLSLISYGDAYIQNDTGLTPDTEALLTMDINMGPSIEYLSASSVPKVLIIHTHGTEAYSKDGAISYLDNGSEIARSSDTQKNVVSVGKALSDKLNKLGIVSIHCEIMHDNDGYRYAYDKASETIQRYLEQYPSIELVIDLHRDAVIKSDGSLVRPITLVNNKPTAQVMCVVGSNWGGQENTKWERNLALALQLRKELNSEHENICRPPYLKSSTYNQEFAPSSLLVEIGACGNSLQEAILAAETVGEALAKIIKK